MNIPADIDQGWRCTFGHCKTKAEVLTEKKRFYALIQADTKLDESARDELIKSLIVDSRIAIQVLPWQVPGSQEWSLYEDHIRHYNLHLMKLPYNRNQKQPLTAAEVKEQEGLSLGDRKFAHLLAQIVRWEGHYVSNPYQFYKKWSQECRNRQDRLNPIQFEPTP